MSFPISHDRGDHWATTASFGDFTWSVKDYGDQLSWEFACDELKDDLNSVSLEKNQCMILHLAAGIEHDGNNTCFTSIMKRGAIIRSEIYAQAKRCHDTIGDLSGEVPLIRAELKAHAHDACKRNHDKDNRLLLCFPPPSLRRVNLCMINVAPSMRFSAHQYLHSDLKTARWAFLISPRNHMRLALPPGKKAEEIMLSNPVSVSTSKGWGALLIDDTDRATIAAKALNRCPTCQEDSIRFPPWNTGYHGRKSFN